MEAWLDKVMVERTCPDCNGARVRGTRLLFTIHGRSIYDLGQLHFDELHEFLGTVKPAGRGADAGRQVLKEIRGRLELLLGIGLDYLSFNRRSGTLSGGESQRIRLSTQIGSGLMGMELRATREEESAGLDIPLHGEEAYMHLGGMDTIAPVEAEVFNPVPSKSPVVSPAS